MTQVSRAERASATREAILAAAERMFAEHGVNAVSLRQIGEAAGQGNNTAVSYHFGNKIELIRAIVRKHGEPTEADRRRMVDAVGGDPAVRDWVTCLVRPVTGHLAALGTPTWFARFTAQLMTDPGLREVVLTETEILPSPSLRRILDGLDLAVPALPAPVYAERSAMGRHLIVHVCAEFERDLAAGAPGPRKAWDDVATGLIDAITAVWLAPVTDAAELSQSLDLENSQRLTGCRKRVAGRRPLPDVRQRDRERKGARVAHAREQVREHDSLDMPLDYPLERPAALEPPAEWEPLRAQCPVARVRLPSGDEASLLTRHRDVKQVLSDPRFGRMLAAPDAARITAAGSDGIFSKEAAGAIPQTGPGHERWRRLLNRWFTARRMAGLRPGIEEMANRLIDDMVAKGRPADLKASLAFPLPVWVICDMLGVPDRDRDKFAHWSDAMLSLTRYTGDEIRAARAEFTEYMARHIDARRAAPADDLLSELITASNAEGQGLSADELVATGRGLLMAGHETTANMIGKMTAMLLSDRRRWERLVADRSLVRTAVEESLRFDAALGFGMVRYIDVDVEVGGTLVPRGTTVVCDMAAANRDETAFEGAGEMDVTRSPNPHLSFGVGSHSCLGQALARTELQAVLDVLLRRLPSLELAVPAAELRLVEGLLVTGLEEVPVTWKEN